MLKMRAAVLRNATGHFVCEDVTIDAPRQGEVLVRIVATGLCHTDLMVRDRDIAFPLPAVLGHEGAGIVETVGPDVTQFAPGDHVVMTFGHCGRCGRCIEGKPYFCEMKVGLNFTGRRVDGSSVLRDRDGNELYSCFFCQSSFGEFAITRTENLVKVPKNIPLNLLGPLGCGIQTGAGAVLNVLRPEPGTSISVFGIGAVGLAAIMAAKAIGLTKIIAVDRHEERLDLAHELGATDVINVNHGDAVSHIRTLSNGGTDYAVECVGSPTTVRQAVESLRMGGECAMTGAMRHGSELVLDASLMLGGRTLRGVLQGASVPQVFIPRLIELWRAGLFPFDRMIRLYPLSDIETAVRDSKCGVTPKAVLVMDEGAAT